MILFLICKHDVVSIYHTYTKIVMIQLRSIYVNSYIHSLKSDIKDNI